MAITYKSGIKKKTSDRRRKKIEIIRIIQRKARRKKLTEQTGDRKHQLRWEPPAGSVTNQ